MKEILLFRHRIETNSSETGRKICESFLRSFTPFSPPHDGWRYPDYIEREKALARIFADGIAMPFSAMFGKKGQVLGVDKKNHEGNIHFWFGSLGVQFLLASDGYKQSVDNCMQGKHPRLRSSIDIAVRGTDYLGSVITYTLSGNAFAKSITSLFRGVAWSSRWAVGKIPTGVRGKFITVSSKIKSFFNKNRLVKGGKLATSGITLATILSLSGDAPNTDYLKAIDAYDSIISGDSDDEIKYRLLFDLFVSLYEISRDEFFESDLQDPYSFPSTVEDRIRTKFILSYCAIRQKEKSYSQCGRNFEKEIINAKSFIAPYLSNFRNQVIEHLRTHTTKERSESANIPNTKNLLEQLEATSDLVDNYPVLNAAYEYSKEQNISRGFGDDVIWFTYFTEIIIPQVAPMFLDPKL